MERPELPRQNGPVESAVIGAQDRSSAGRELHREARARGHDSPGVQRPQPLNRPAGLFPLRVERWKVRADRAAVVVPDAEIERQAAANANRVHRKEARRDELAASREGIAEHRLKWLTVVVRVLHATRK